MLETRRLIQCSLNIASAPVEVVASVSVVVVVIAPVEVDASAVTVVVVQFSFGKCVFLNSSSCG